MFSSTDSEGHLILPQHALLETLVSTVGKHALKAVLVKDVIVYLVYAEVILFPNNIDTFQH